MSGNSVLTLVEIDKYISPENKVLWAEIKECYLDDIRERLKIGVNDEVPDTDIVRDTLVEIASENGDEFPFRSVFYKKAFKCSHCDLLHRTLTEGMLVATDGVFTKDSPLGSNIEYRKNVVIAFEIERSPVPMFVTVEFEELYVVPDSKNRIVMMKSDDITLELLDECQVPSGFH